jgi:hypothetical protein
LAVGGALVAVMALLAGLVAAAGDGDERAGGQSTTTTTTTTGVQTGERRLSGTIAVDEESMRRAGLVVFGDDDFALVSFDGTELGRGPLAGWSANNRDLGVDVEGVSGSWSLTEAPAIDEPVPGCGVVHGAGRIRVAVCGAEHKTGEIRLVAADGRSRLLSGAIQPVGHWRYALPSPDGRWVLAQWSGECEVPVAYLFPTAGGPGGAVAGADGETVAVGWAPDGRAVVGFWAGACGAGSDAPGTYLVEPDTGRRRRLHAYVDGALLTSVRGFFPNRLERVMSRAHHDLGLEECCSQPSHGGGGAETGFVFEDHDIGVYAAPLDELPDSRDVRPGELRFDCGTTRYHLSDWGPSGAASSSVPDPRLVRRAASLLLPGLYCTPGPIAFTTP